MAVRAFSIEDGNTSGSTVNSTRDREYKDIDLTLTKKPTGDVYKKESLDSVKQAVKNLLLTNEFEKPFRPFFGGNLNSLLFELADDYFDTDLDEQIRTAISNYEPRAEVVGLDIDHEPDRNNIACTVTFRVINLNVITSVTTSVSRVR